MKVNLQKWMLRVLVAAFCAALAWWIFYLPYDNNAVLRAIPTDVSVVSVHDNVAARWADISGSSLVRCLACSAGMKAADVDEAASDGALLEWINRLTRRQVAIAYVPSLNGTGREAWLVSSWIGGYGQRLKWMASLGLIPDVKMAGTYGRQQIWTAPISGARGNLKLSVAVSEGVLMCCISSLPEGVRAMVEAFDGVDHVAPGISAGRLSQDAAILRHCPSPDRGWVSPGDGWPPFSFEISALRGSNSCGRIRARYALSGDTAPLKACELEGLGMLLGDVPEIVSVFRSRQALKMLSLPGIPPESKMVFDIVRDFDGIRADRRMFLCLFGGKYRGRMTSIMPEGLGDLIGGIPVPVIMAGIEVDDADNAGHMMTETLDRLNTDYRLGIIVQPIQVGDEAVMTLEGTGPGAYGNFAKEERIAYAICGGWLVLSSNADALSKLVARYQREEAKKEALSARWLKSLGNDDGAIAFAWSDLAAAGVTLKDGLALWKLSMQFDQSSENRRIRSLLVLGMNWMDAIRQLRCGSIAVGSDGTITELRFVQGE